MSVPHVHSVVLGDGAYVRALSFVFGAQLVPDSWLAEGKWGLRSLTSIPLKQCQRVFLVLSPTESMDRAHWRHDCFWELYGRFGGKIEPGALGLKWLLIDLNTGTKDSVPPPSRFCLRVNAAEGLHGISASLGKAPICQYFDWHEDRLSDRELSLRLEILRRVQGGDTIKEVQSEIIRLAGGFSPLSWERFCPPPEEHTLANRIRAWLSASETHSVTQWFTEGNHLLRQTNLNS